MSLKPKHIDFDIEWSGLINVMSEIINLGVVHRSSWNDTFSVIYSLCTALPDPFTDELYRSIKSFLGTHVEKCCEVVKKHLDELIVYHGQWKCFYQGSTYLNHLCMYLNSQYISKLKLGEHDGDYVQHGVTCAVEDSVEDILVVGQTALKMWKENMLNVVHEPIVCLLLKNIENTMLKILKAPFLKETENYYRIKAGKLVQENDFTEYMEKVISLLEAENLRSTKYLHKSSYKKVKAVCEEKLVIDHMDLFKAECLTAVNNENLKDLKNLFILLKPVGSGIEALKNAFKEHVTKVGIDITKLNSNTMPHHFVLSVIEVHSKYTKLIKDVFSGDALFIGALDQACAKIVNRLSPSKNVSSSPELLAKYSDHLLKKNSKGMSENDIDEKISQSITVFKYLDNKDEFQACYRKMLAKRLIFGLSASIDAEEQMLNQLKQECGFEFIKDMKRMYGDICLSSTLKSNFMNYLTENKTDLSINVSFLILQDGAWPFSSANRPSFAFPHQLEKCIQVYENFYKESFTGRKLYWLHPVSTAELKLNYLKKPYLVTMGTLQMAVLLLFDDTDTWNYIKLQQIIQLDHENLKKQLKSIIDAKLLLPSHLEDPLNENCSYTLNMNYSNKRTKFKINAVLHKETAPDRERESQKIADDRFYFLNATIVRIMKHRQQIKHNLLIQEILTQARGRFIPTISQIKKSIEAMIEKGYIDRKNEEQDLYRYIA
ncbi:Cullin-2 [Nymphon striatum]|nr:Cullin-2 [Nymphon striatum]